MDGISLSGCMLLFMCLSYITGWWHLLIREVYAVKNERIKAEVYVFSFI